VNKILTNNNIAFYLFSGLLFVLPFGGPIVVYFLVAILLDFLIQKKWNQLSGFFSFANYSNLLTVLFVFIAISLLWTNNFKAGKFEIEQKLSLLILPIICYANKDWMLSKIKNLLCVFVASNVLVSCIAIIEGVLKKMQHVHLLADAALLPMYSEFSPYLHVAYFAFYLSFATVISIHFLIHSASKYEKLFLLISIIICSIALYFSSSKGAFLSILFMLSFMAIIEFIQSKSKVKLGLILIGLFVVLIVTVKNNPRIYSVKKMFTEILHPENVDPNASSDISNGQRIFVIKSSLQVISENVICGVGAGDVIDELEKKYIVNNYKVLAHKKLNAHNQFLDFFIELGLIGGVLFLIINVMAIYHSIKKRNFLQIYFVIGFVIISCTESFLNHQAGIVFYCLMFCLLFVSKLKLNHGAE
jgi:O-antigen ligase